MSRYVLVTKKPKCDLPDCDNKAYADCKTEGGLWANLCRPHFLAIGVGIGTGVGQIFVTEDEVHAEDCDCRKCRPAGKK